MATNQDVHNYLRSLGISEHEIAGYNLSAYNGDRKALKQAIDQAIRNAVTSHLSPEYDEDDSDTYEMEDETEDVEDIDHLPGKQKRSKAEKREARLTEVTGRLAAFVDGVTLDELRQQAMCGNVARERQAAAKIQALYREADRYLSE